MRHITLVLTAVGLVMAACGFGVPRASAPPAVGDASRVDMCTVLTDAELAGLGIRLDSRRQVNQLGEVGCSWGGQDITLGLLRDRDTLAVYQARDRRYDPAFTSFADSPVNGRPGAHLSVERSRADCTQLMDGGPVSLVVDVAPAGLSKKVIDSCAEALRISQMIEPRLPKAGR